MLKNKLLLLGVLVMLLYALNARAENQCQEAWQHFKKRFIVDNERVVDPYMGNYTHSEGQAYAMLIALKNDDRELFDNIVSWTNKHLGKGLKSWRYKDGKVTDINNATDADIIITWSLFKAYEQWKNDKYRHMANENLSIIEGSLIKKNILIPWVGAKDNRGNTIVNLSYYVFPALKEFEKYSTQPLKWRFVYEQGISMLKDSLRPKHNLPPDWLVINDDGVIGSYLEKPDIFGSDAIRIALYLKMAKDPNINIFSDYLKYVEDNGGKIGLNYDFRHDEFLLPDANAGVYSIMGGVAESLGQVEMAKKIYKIANVKITEEGDDYYANVLYLLHCNY